MNERTGRDEMIDSFVGSMIGSMVDSCNCHHAREELSLQSGQILLNFIILFNPAKNSIPDVLYFVMRAFVLLIMCML